jgi:hypothetical protein
MQQEIETTETQAERSAHKIRLRSTRRPSSSQKSPATSPGCFGRSAPTRSSTAPPSRRPASTARCTSRCTACRRGRRILARYHCRPLPRRSERPVRGRGAAACRRLSSSSGALPSQAKLCPSRAVDRYMYVMYLPLNLRGAVCRNWSFLAFVLPSRACMLAVKAQAQSTRRRAGAVRRGAQPPAACGCELHHSTLLHAQQPGVRPSHSPQQLVVACTPRIAVEHMAQRCATCVNGRAHRHHVPVVRRAVHRHDVPARGSVRDLQGGIAVGSALVVGQPQEIPAGLPVRDTEM